MMIYTVDLPLVGYDTEYIKNALTWIIYNYDRGSRLWASPPYNNFNRCGFNYIDGVARFYFKNKEDALLFKLTWR